MTKQELATYCFITPGIKWGVLDKKSGELMPGICEDTMMLAEARLCAITGRIPKGDIVFCVLDDKSDAERKL